MFSIDALFPVSALSNAVCIRVVRDMVVDIAVYRTKLNLNACNS